jgi:hypothetical protein
MHKVNLPDRAEPVPEWELEPNEVTFVSHGYWCEIKRHDSLGHLCGYVLLGKKHPYWNLNQDFAVHGGLTYEDGIKVGFDCGHAGDMSPHARLRNYRFEETYRNVAYVKEQVENLAAQLRAVDPIMDIQPKEKPDE